MIAPAITPGSRHAKACEPMSIDYIDPEASKTSSSWRSVGRVVGVDVGRPRGRDEVRTRRASAKTAQARVGEDRVPVRLDDVDRPSGVGAGRGRRLEGPATVGAWPRMWTIWLAGS